jgi:threonine aldolase
VAQGPKQPETLEAACDRVLLASMHAGLKEALDAALAGGATAAQVLARVRAQTGGPLAQPGGLTYLAVEAYLEHKQKEPR